MKRFLLIFTFHFSLFTSAFTQEKKTLTHADTLRGSITPERAWWDVLRYDITVKPDYKTKTIIGKNTVSFKSSVDGNKIMQIDLQPPLTIDSISNENGKIEIKKIDVNVYYAFLKNIESKMYIDKAEGGKGWITKENSIIIYYHGAPHEAVNPPWDNGWVWTKDSLGRPWMSVACQDIGASIWYPCKDHQSDEPDNGASLSIIVPDTLMAVGNGRLASTQKNNDGTTTYKWEIKSPINNYEIIPYIGKYVNFSEVYKGEKGNLDVNYWVLDYNINKAKEHIQPDVERMLKAFEYWMGPYPFYEDGYKIIDAPYLGMEHQSAIAYGNNYLEGYLNNDRSATGWGLKWDFIIVHESGHEWFGNNITSKDIADMWIHEGFATYSETLFTEFYYGKEAGNEYNFGQRHIIKNDEPIIGIYNVNDEGSADEYEKGANMINIIRHVINDDSLFKNILRGLNKTFYHQTVTTKQIEDYINRQAKIDFNKVFDQYLRTTQIPQLSYYYSKDSAKVFYKWDSCISGFNMQLVLWHNNKCLRIKPTQQWQTLNKSAFFNTDWINKKYYINIKEVKTIARNE